MPLAVFLAAGANLSGAALVDLIAECEIPLKIAESLFSVTGKPIMLAKVPFFPDFSHLSTIVLAASIFLFYGGMEIQAVHFHLTPALGLEK